MEPAVERREVHPRRRARDGRASRGTATATRSIGQRHRHRHRGGVPRQRLRHASGRPTPRARGSSAASGSASRSRGGWSSCTAARIQAASDGSGRGATFTVRLPVRAPEAAAPPDEGSIRTAFAAVGGTARGDHGPHRGRRAGRAGDDGLRPRGSRRDRAGGDVGGRSPAAGRRASPSPRQRPRHARYRRLLADDAAARDARRRGAHRRHRADRLCERARPAAFGGRRLPAAPGQAGRPAGARRRDRRNALRSRDRP